MTYEYKNITYFLRNLEDIMIVNGLFSFSSDLRDFRKVVVPKILPHLKEFETNIKHSSSITDEEILDVFVEDCETNIDRNIQNVLFESKFIEQSYDKDMTKTLKNIVKDLTIDSDFNTNFLMSRYIISSMYVRRNIHQYTPVLK